MTITVLALVQLTLALWVRTALVDAAGEGARHAALVGATVDDGAARAREVLTLALGGGYAASADVVEVRTETRGGVEVAVLDLSARLPLVGLLGPSGMLHASGSAVLER